MRWYNADVGSWERGLTVEFQASDQDSALTIADYEATKVQGEVVQIRLGKRDEHGKCIFDYMNGFYDRGWK